MLWTLIWMSLLCLSITFHVDLCRMIFEWNLLFSVYPSHSFDSINRRIHTCYYCFAPTSMNANILMPYINGMVASSQILILENASKSSHVLSHITHSLFIFRMKLNFSFCRFELYMNLVRTHTRKFRLIEVKDEKRSCEELYITRKTIPRICTGRYKPE